MTKGFVVDLDGTLLHPEPEAIAVPGRSGYAYLSREAAARLTELSRRHPLIVATGRNRRSVRRLIRQLPALECAGFVFENGLVCHADCADAGESEPLWSEIAAAFPHWERLPNYERCFGAIVPEAERAAAAARLRQALDDLSVAGAHVYTERHKIFAALEAPDKLAGVQRLEALPHIALGNDWNDLGLLRASTHIATLADATVEAREIVRERGGYCSPWRSHRGAADLLAWVERL